MEKKNSTPLRMCIGCRKMFDKRDLLRIVRTPEGVKIDTTGKMNGRGAYLCRNAECFVRCIKSKAISRQLKCEVDADMQARIAEIIQQT